MRREEIAVKSFKSEGGRERELVARKKYSESVRENTLKKAILMQVEMKLAK